MLQFHHIDVSVWGLGLVVTMISCAPWPVQCVVTQGGYTGLTNPHIHHTMSWHPPIIASKENLSDDRSISSSSLALAPMDDQSFHILLNHKCKQRYFVLSLYLSQVCYSKLTERLCWQEKCSPGWREILRLTCSGGLPKYQIKSCINHNNIMWNINWILCIKCLHLLCICRIPVSSRYITLTRNL